MNPGNVRSMSCFRLAALLILIIIGMVSGVHGETNDALQVFLDRVEESSAKVNSFHCDFRQEILARGDCLLLFKLGHGFIIH